MEKRTIQRKTERVKRQTKTQRVKNGGKTALPIYYRNKIYSEEEREKLWLNKLDNNVRWIEGIKVKADDEERISISNG